MASEPGETLSEAEAAAEPSFFFLWPCWVLLQETLPLADVFPEQVEQTQQVAGGRG